MVVSEYGNCHAKTEHDIAKLRQTSPLLLSAYTPSSTKFPLALCHSTALLSLLPPPSPTLRTLLIANDDEHLAYKPIALVLNSRLILFLHRYSHVFIRLWIAFSIPPSVRVARRPTAPFSTPTTSQCIKNTIQTSILHTPKIQGTRLPRLPPINANPIPRTTNRPNQ